MNQGDLPHDTEIVLLINVGSEVEALMLAHMLRDEGIQVLVRSSGPGAGAWASAATFDHSLFVRSDELERAQSVIGTQIERANTPRVRIAAPTVNRTRRKR